MQKTEMDLNGMKIPCVTLSALVVGTGAAGYNAALRLRENGAEDIAVVTEGVCAGTSRNTGSDKQTYYKLSLSGDAPDSPFAMAKDFFGGKCVDGDHAYAEAALSVPSFFHLVSLGVPFPTNRYGEYVGYQTDHDRGARATSAGPLTSRLMTECLQKEAERQHIPVFDGYTAVRVLKKDGDAVGLLCYNGNPEGKEKPFTVFITPNIIFATGGPAGAYADTVYPVGHHGASGVLFEAGVKGKNLTEWQYGLASVSPRWNVSGTYMQVLPRFVSVDEKGEEHEFLTEYYGDAGKMLSMEFRKGYEWPFDSRKAKDGSSVIDLLVYTETKIKGRRVYLDFRKNPMGFEELPFDSLTPEAYDYLQNAGALFGTPLERLGHMNQPAIDLYLEKGVDLSREMLEIALCAQHNNGGADVDMWWQSGIPGLFVAGEAAGTHGVYRPGGSALNAGQVGSMRAAQYIAKRRPRTPLTPEELFAACREDVEKEAYVLYNARRKENTASRLLSWARERMSKYGGAIRSPEAVKRAREETLRVFRDWENAGCGDCPRDLYLLKDALICQIMLLYAMENYAAEGGKTRGSALCVDPDGEAPAGFPRSFAFVTDGGEKDGLTQIVSFENGEPQAVWRPVRPLPEGGGFFENVWKSFRENGNIY